MSKWYAWFTEYPEDGSIVVEAEGPESAMLAARNALDADPDSDITVSEMDGCAQPCPRCASSSQEAARLRELEVAARQEHGGKHHEPECPICAALSDLDRMRGSGNDPRPT